MGAIFRGAGRSTLAILVLFGMVVVTGNPAAADPDPGSITVTYPANLTVAEDIGTFDVVVERDSGSDDLTLNLTLGGTALKDTDYTVSAESDTFSAGDSSYTFTFTIDDDNEGENPGAGALTGKETIEIAVDAHVVGDPSEVAAVTNPSSTVEIEDDITGDRGIITLSLSDSSVDEDTGTFDVILTRTGGSEGDWNSSIQGFINPSRVNMPFSSITFAHGEDGAKSLTFAPVNNNVNDGDALVSIQATGAQDSPQLLTVVDDDAASTASFDSATSTTTETDTDFILDIPLTLSTAFTGSVQVPVVATAGTNADAFDFTLLDTEADFAPFTTTTKIRVRVNADDLVEGPQTINLVLTGPLGSGQVTHAITINDDDSYGVIQIQDLSYGGAEDDLVYNPIVLRRTGGKDGAVSVKIRTKDKTATGGFDYTAFEKTFTWVDQDDVDKLVPINILSDLESEGGETFEVELFDVVNAQLGSNSKENVNIIDSDRPGSVEFTEAATTALEADGEAVLIVRRVGGSDGAISVDFYTKNGTAKSGSDFTGITQVNSQTLTWAHGDTAQKEIRIPLVNDNNNENTQNFKVQLTGLTGTASQGSIFVARVNITNNRVPKAVDDFVAVDRVVVTSLDLLKNDVDPDGKVLKYAGLDTTIEGNRVVCSGFLCTVDAADNFVGEIEFDYTVTDGVRSASATATVQVGPVCTIKGTAGNNTLDGTSGDDVICGLGGNDTIDGKGGNDILVGGPGNDTIIGGSGANEILGGSGTDTAEVAGTAGKDTVLVSDSKVVVGTVATVLKDVETVKVTAAGGNDTVNVSPSASVTFELDGGGGFDELNYNAGGLTSYSVGTSVITAAGRKPVEYSSFDVVVADESLILGTDNVDSQIIGGTDALGNTVDLLDSGDNLTVYAGNLKGPLTVSDTGKSGTDSVTILDFTGTSTHVLTPGQVLLDSEKVTLAGIEKLTIMGRGGTDVFKLSAGTAGFAYEIHLFGGTDKTSKDSFSIDLGTRSYRIDKVARRIIVSGMADIFYNDFTSGTVTSTVTGTKSIAVGYWMADSTGKIYAFGDAAQLGDVPASPGSFTVKVAPSVTGNGYFGLDSNGVVSVAGDAKHLGNLNTAVLEPGERAATMATSPDGKGYWIFTTRGRAQAFGTAKHFGDLVTLGIVPAGPVVDSVALPDGKGYYMVGSDGGVFSFGSSKFYGSMGGLALNSPVNGLVPDPDGKGYWLVAADGGVFAFDAGFVGSVPGALPTGAALNAPINGMVAYGDGYLMVATDGGIFNFSGLAFFGSLGGQSLPNQIVAVAVLDV